MIYKSNPKTTSNIDYIDSSEIVYLNETTVHWLEVMSNEEMNESAYTDMPTVELTRDTRKYMKVKLNNRVIKHYEKGVVKATDNFYDLVQCDQSHFKTEFESNYKNSRR